MSGAMRRIVISVVAAAAIVGLGVGFSMARKPAPVTRTGIEGVSPLPGDLDLRQVEISADLAAGYTGVLFLDGVEIPEDDVQRVAAINKISLRPAVGSPYAQLSPGAHTAAVEYWPIVEGRSRADVYRWHFNLH